MLLTLAVGLMMTSLASETPPHLDAAQIKAIDQYIAAEIERQRVPGLSLGIYKNGTAVLKKGYGLANIELNVPMTADSVLQSGSVGKIFTATGVMMLVEEGKVDLNDSIVKYFPEAPASWKPIRVANLLSHTSGLSSFDTVELQVAGGPFDIRQDFTEDELVAGITKLPLDFRPGESWTYENTNFVLLGALIHRVTGQFYGDFLKSRIFAPLGMKSTRIVSDIDIVPNRSAGYEIVGGVLQNQQWMSPTFTSTADGEMYFTVDDLEHWDRALYSETLLKADTLKAMWTPYPYGGKTPAEGYGLGWEITHVNGHRVVEHDGAMQGFTTAFSRYLDDGLTIVVLTNLDSDHSDPGVILRNVAGLIDPALKIAPRKAIVDEKADLSKKTWARFRHLMEVGQDGELPASQATFSKAKITDLKRFLPEEWARHAPTLIDRAVDGEKTDSTYRIGGAGNSRLLHVGSNAAGEVLDRKSVV